MIYTISEIQAIVTPIAQKHKLKAVYLFGSYARGTATENSDVDLLIDTEGTAIKSLLDLAAVYCELEEALGKPIDLLTLSSFAQSTHMPSETAFRNTVNEERRTLYAVA